MTAADGSGFIVPMTLLAHIADRTINVPLCILPTKAEVISSVLGGRIGIESGIEQIPNSRTMARSGSSRSASASYSKSNGVAVIGMTGTLINRGGWIAAESGLTSYFEIARQIRAADADPDVTSIIIDADSPGGEAIGAFECADVVHAIARKRPVVTVTTGLCCSAAYAIASATTRIVTTKSSFLGSIGVVMLHVEKSRMLDKAGVSTTLIHAGARKVDGSPYQPLTDEVRDLLQADIDTFYELFVSTVGRNRPTLGTEGARATEAATYIGEQAVRAGLADTVGTLDEVYWELAALHPSTKSKKYELTRAVYGEISANAELIADVHSAGVRAGHAEAMAQRIKASI